MKQKYKSRAFWSIILTISAFILSNPALAKRDLTLEQLLDLPFEDLLNVKISVSSRFIESPLEAGSTSIVIKEKQWRSLGARRLSDAIGNLPSTIVLPNWFGAEPIYIRGYADGNNTNGIATLIDGVGINLLEGSPQFTRQNFNLGTLDRIELIRGPGSALYGESAFHGVMALHTFESDVDLTRINANFSSNRFYDGSVKHSQAINDLYRVNFSAAVSGQSEQNQEYDYIDSGTGNLLSSERDMLINSKTVALKINRLPHDNLSYDFGFYYDDNHYSDFYSSGSSGSIASDDTGGVDSRFYMLKLGGEYQINQSTDAELKLYYYDSERTFDRSFKPFRASPSFIGIGNLEGKGKEQTTGASLIFKQELEATRWSLDLSSRFSEMGDYRVKQTDETGAVFNAFPLAFSNYSRDVYSLSFDAATQFNKKWLLHYGFRYDDYSDFGAQFSPRLGLIYQPTQDSALKLLYGNAFRAPGAGEIKGFATVITDSDLEPETIDTYELVYIKTTENLHQEYILFKSYWDNAITNINFTNTNTGENESEGAEAIITYQTDVWDFPFSVSYVRSDNKLNNQDYVAFPEWIVNAGVVYRWKAKKIDIKLNNRIHLNASEGQIVGSSVPEELKDYWRVDLHMAMYWSPNTTFFLDIRNLFDRENFIPSVQQNPSLGGLSDESISIKLGLKHSF